MVNKQQAIQEIAEKVKQHHCSLRSGCIQPVPGDGNPESQMVFIGEAPGRKEDEAGRPFVGPAGKILESLLDKIDFKRSDVYITNVVKCRPPENRDPSLDEVNAHQKFLQAELEIIQPKLVVLLGRHALDRFIPGQKISQCRGTAMRRGDYIYFPIYHPAAVLHNPNLLADLQNDFMKIPALLNKIMQGGTTKSNSHPQHIHQLTFFN